MNNSSVWNLFNPLRSGGISLLGSGQEMFGTVIKQGTCKKTIKVRVHYRFWNHMYRKYYSRYSNYLVHDDESFCRVGDKVVIKSCGGNVSKMKHYYVRNVVKQFPRNDYYIVNPESTIETKEEYHQLYRNFVDQELKKRLEDSEKEKDSKTKALLEAMENMKLKEMEEKDEKTRKLESKKRKEEKRNQEAEKNKSKRKKSKESQNQ